MKTFTKTGRKVIGALVTAAVIFSMIPAMFAIADTDPGLKTVTINSISNQVGSSGSRNFNGIRFGRSFPGKYYDQQTL